MSVISRNLHFKKDFKTEPWRIPSFNDPVEEIGSASHLSMRGQIDRSKIWRAMCHRNLWRGCFKPDRMTKKSNTAARKDNMKTTDEVGFSQMEVTGELGENFWWSARSRCHILVDWVSGRWKVVSQSVATLSLFSSLLCWGWRWGPDGGECPHSMLALSLFGLPLGWGPIYPSFHDSYQLQIPVYLTWKYKASLMLYILKSARGTHFIIGVDWETKE